MLRIFWRLSGCGKALPRGNRGTPWNKAQNDCDHPPNVLQKGCIEMCDNRCQWISLTMVARDPETKLNNRTVLASTGKRPVEIEHSFFCPHGHGSMMMQPRRSRASTRNFRRAVQSQDSAWCDVRLVDRESFEGADANMVPIGDDETPCL